MYMFRVNNKPDKVLTDIIDVAVRSIDTIVHYRHCNTTSVEPFGPSVLNPHRWVLASLLETNKSAYVLFKYCFETVATQTSTEKHPIKFKRTLAQLKKI